eukprot:5103077-Prymnesium_polylepis.2
MDDDSPEILASLIWAAAETSVLRYAAQLDDEAEMLCSALPVEFERDLEAEADAERYAEVQASVARALDEVMRSHEDAAVAAAMGTH